MPADPQGRPRRRHQHLAGPQRRASAAGRSGDAVAAEPGTGRAERRREELGPVAAQFIERLTADSELWIRGSGLPGDERSGNSLLTDHGPARTLVREVLPGMGRRLGIGSALL